MSVTRTLPPGDSYYSLSLIGSTGAAYADDHHNTQLLFGRGHPIGLETGQGDGAVLAQMREFLAAIEEKRDPLYERMRKLYEQRKEFMSEDPTGFVWLYLQK